MDDRRTRERRRRAIAIVVLCRLLAAGTAPAAPRPPDGAAVFKARCARCHGESGRTDTASGRVLKVRPLVADDQLARMTVEDIVTAIRTDAKHQAVGALGDVSDRELEAAARFVKELAARR
jgi:mono/diheme cytochrome c family protein